MNCFGWDDDVILDFFKFVGFKFRNFVVVFKVFKVGDVFVFFVVKNNGQDWFWFVYYFIEINIGMIMYVEGIIIKGFMVKFICKIIVEKFEFVMGIKLFELIKLQWVEKCWWDEDMFVFNKVVKVEVFFEIIVYGVKFFIVIECVFVKEIVIEMVMDRMIVCIKCKDDKIWVFELCEVLVCVGVFKQNVLIFFEKFKDSYGIFGGKKFIGFNVSLVNFGKQLICGIFSRGGDSFFIKINRFNMLSIFGNVILCKIGNVILGKFGNGILKKGVIGKFFVINVVVVNKQWVCIVFQCNIFIFMFWLFRWLEYNGGEFGCFLVEIGVVFLFFCYVWLVCWQCKWCQSDKLSQYLKYM